MKAMSTFTLTPSDPLVDLVCTVNSSSGGNSVISVAVNDADKKFVVGAVIRECCGESKGGTLTHSFTPFRTTQN